MIRIFFIIGFCLSLNINAQNQLGFERVHTLTVVDEFIQACTGWACYDERDSLAFYIVPQEKVIKINKIYSDSESDNGSYSCNQYYYFILNGVEINPEDVNGIWLKAGDSFYFKFGFSGNNSNTYCSNMTFSSIVSFTEYSIISD